eukprot:1159830-Pelagomonas_calceolata.AAC.2
MTRGREANAVPACVEWEGKWMKTMGSRVEGQQKAYEGVCMVRHDGKQAAKIHLKERRSRRQYKILVVWALPARKARKTVVRLAICLAMNGVLPIERLSAQQERQRCISVRAGRGEQA